jgi:DNA-binding transcriptional LysR family regulator
LGSENGPHQYTYNATPDPKQDTVVAAEACSEPAVGSSPAPVRQEPAQKGRVLKLHPDELVWLAPRLMPYLRRPNPTWPEVPERLFRERNRITGPGGLQPVQLCRQVAERPERGLAPAPGVLQLVLGEP